MLTSIVVLLATLATASADVWPMPRSVAISTSSVNVNATITASASTPSNRLSQIMARYATSFLLDTGVEADLDVGFDEIRLDVLTTDESLTQATDVSYNITAASSSSSSVVVISSATIYGAQYGLETLKQMLSGGPTLPQSIDVVDSPTYNHRGFMVDTGRRFVPLQVILDNLDAMAMTKLNVLHLHFADWCRFAIEVRECVRGDTIPKPANIYTPSHPTSPYPSCNSLLSSQSENFPQLTAALTDE